MKTLNNLLGIIRKEERKELTSLVHETIALDFNDKKFFTAADMWNIQRQKRGTFQRRYI